MYTLINASQRCSYQYADNPELRECVNALSARDAILEPGIAKTFEQLVKFTLE